MQTETRKLIFPFLLVGLVFVVSYVALFSFEEILQAFMITSTLVISLFVGFWGIRIFAEDGFLRNDSFHMLNILLSLGLIVSGISESASVIISQFENGSAFYFTYSLVLLIALLFWSVGIISYLKSSNVILGFFEEKKLFLYIILISSVSLVAGFILIVIIPEQPLRIEMLIDLPISMGFAVLTISSLILIWLFRDGALSLSMIFLFCGMLLELLRNALWCFLAIIPSNPLSLFIATLGYLSIGLSVVIARNLDTF